MTIADMKQGQTATILRYVAWTAATQRLLALGLLEGTRVEFVRTAPTGDPIEVLVLDYHLSLRRSEAAAIEVEIDASMGGAA